ncbi:protein TIC 22-like, chloroplastic [Malania oleifera]|uniref:protein TIC 22-like, chloroplastic n=1 Tax=Malania oleifera TaxID=397392 RepID=UPI0025AE69B3|nr:protein TIC 22-like, chloroplastic [Malania oleifera]
MKSETSSSSPPKPPQAQLNLHHAFTNLQSHCSGFLHQFSPSLPQHRPQNLFSHSFNSLKTHIESALSNLGNQATRASDAACSRFGSGSGSGSSLTAKTPVWAWIAERNESQFKWLRRSGAAMSTKAIEERLAGVPVYALSNSSEEFVLVSGIRSGKSLGLFCFKKEDAEALLEQMKSMDPTMRQGSKVVEVALNKVFQLQVDGVAFRLIPEASQIKNAVKEWQKVGVSDEGFPGVPVFQSRSLILKSQDKRYRPLFFRKEDLEKSLLRASQQQRQLNPALRQGDILVAVLEEIIKGMKDSSTSKWDDVVFVPPGFDVSTDPSQL